MAEIEIVSDTQIECSDTVVRLPAAVLDSKRIDPGRVVVFDPDTAGASEPDFELPGPCRNVVLIDADCQVEWIVDEVEDPPTSDFYHRRVNTDSGRLYTLSSTDDHFYKIDPETGEVRHWKRTHWRNFLVNRSAGVIRGPDSTLRLPFAIDDVASSEDRLVVVLDPDDPGQSTPANVDIPSDRPILAVSPDCQVKWIADEIPDPDGPGDCNPRCYFHRERLIKRTESGGYYELDPESGVLLASWSAHKFRIAGQVRSFEGRVASVTPYQDVTLVRTRSDGDNAEMVAVDVGTGNVRWRRQEDMGWQLATDQEGFLVGYEETMGIRHSFRLDPETGEITEQLRGPPTNLAERIVEEG